MRTEHRGVAGAATTAPTTVATALLKTATANSYTAAPLPATIFAREWLKQEWRVRPSLVAIVAAEAQLGGGN